MCCSEYFSEKAEQQIIKIKVGCVQLKVYKAKLHTRETTDTRKQQKMEAHIWSAQGLAGAMAAAGRDWQQSRRHTRWRARTRWRCACA